MRKTFIAFGLLMTIHTSTIQFPTIAQAALEIPAYAKWGRLAIKETKVKYPNAHIIDYLHEGNDSTGDITIEKFKLWLKEGDHEFGLFIRIHFDKKTEKVVKIEFRETDR